MKAPKTQHGVFLLLMMTGLLLTAPAHALAKFMTLPFTDPDVHIQQGWLYDSPGVLCGPSNPDYPYCHYAIDYIKGTVDSPATWLPFTVVAVADGQAQYRPNGSQTWGNYVITKHMVGGVMYYTINAHLATSPLPPNQWVGITRGDPIGTAGKSGLANGLLHLHFEVYKDQLLKTNRVDPYDIYKTKAAYPPHGNCGPGALWVACSARDQQALQDIENRAQRDARFLSAIPETFGQQLDWDPSWELRWLDFHVTGGRLVRIWHATSKVNAAWRYTLFFDPDTHTWNGWTQAF